MSQTIVQNEPQVQFLDGGVQAWLESGLAVAGKRP